MSAMAGITDEMIAKAALALHDLPNLRGHSVAEVTRFAAEALQAGLAGCAVVDLPAPIVFADEHTDVKTWEPDGVDFQVNFHPGDEEKDDEVAFAYWQVSPTEARSVAAAFLAAAELSSGVGGDTR